MDCHEEFLYSLGCTHTFHEECVGTYARLKGVSFWAAPCPVCRFVSRDGDEERAVASSLASASGTMPTRNPVVVDPDSNDEHDSGAVTPVASPVNRVIDPDVQHLINDGSATPRHASTNPLPL